MQIGIDVGDRIQQIKEVDYWEYLRPGALPDNLLPTQELQLIKDAISKRGLVISEVLNRYSVNSHEVAIPLLLQVKSVINKDGTTFKGHIDKAMNYDWDYVRTPDVYLESNPQVVNGRAEHDTKISTYDIDDNVTVNDAAIALYTSLGYKYALLFIAILEG